MEDSRQRVTNLWVDVSASAVISKTPPQLTVRDHVNEAFLLLFPFTGIVGRFPLSQFGRLFARDINYTADLDKEGMSATCSILHVEKCRGETHCTMY